MMQNILGWAWNDRCDPFPEYPVPEVNDVLRIREDLSLEMSGVVSSMLPFAGMEAVIERVDSYESGAMSVKVDVDNGVWNWFYYCFEAPVLEEFEDSDEDAFLRLIGAGVDVV